MILSKFYKKVLLAVALCILTLPVSFAQTNTQEETKNNEINPLPLTTTQIKKLNKLFDVYKTKDAMPALVGESSTIHVVWKQTPINIVLSVNKERMISFPSSVEFGYDKSVLPDDSLKIQNNNGTLYLFAKKNFSTQRVAVRLQNSGQIILLDLSAQKEADSTPIDIVIADKRKEQTPSQLKREADDVNQNGRTDSSINYVTLTRFAVQQLYAPKRLLTQPHAIYRTPMHTHKTIPLLRDGSVMAMPIASWRKGDTTVTAVLLRNTLAQSLTLDPRILCGSWQATTFYPRSVLAPASSQYDATTVFLISQQSFSHALQTCISGEA